MLLLRLREAVCKRSSKDEKDPDTPVDANDSIEDPRCLQVIDRSIVFKSFFAD